jgi:hypothetical protein
VLKKLLKKIVLQADAASLVEVPRELHGGGGRGRELGYDRGKQVQADHASVASFRVGRLTHRALRLRQHGLPM